MSNMTTFFVGLLAIMSTIVFAEEAKVEVTSFQYAGSRTSAAELCGKVTGAKKFPVFVKIVVDEKMDKPGIYNTVVGSESQFCTTVVTRRGTASVSLWNLNSY